MEMTVKAYLQTVDGSVEVRRVPLAVNTQGETTGLFPKLASQLGTAFPGLKGKAYTILWKDSDGDMILMSSDEELQDALAETTSEVLKLYITPGEENSDFEVPSETIQVLEPNASEAEGQAQTEKGNHDQPDPFDEEGNWDMYGPPPSPFHGQGRRQCGRGGPFHPMFGHGAGRRGGHFGRMMAGFVPPPPPPPPVPPFFMGRGGKHGGMWVPPPPPPPPFCPFSFDQCQGSTPCPPPFHGPMRRRGHGCHGKPWMQGGHHWGSMGPFHHGHHQGHGHHHGHSEFGHHGTKGWKRTMRETIPKAHRRWAKSFIRNWRLENVKDATSTSSTSDSDVDKGKQPLDREACGVSEVYQLWLEIMLPRWHANWGGRKPGQDAEANGEKQKNMYKDFVPFEFRKWVKCFLHKHFGQRQSPKLCHKSPRNVRDQGEHCGKHGSHHQGHCNKRAKKSFIKDSVPAKQRVWAKQFILAWRLENQIPTDDALVSDSDISDVEVTGPEAGVPEDYARWMRVFLPRWHMWRGQCSSDKLQPESMNQFKDSVPMEFRRFVKFHLCRRYGRMAWTEGQQSCDSAQYQLWLQAFQKRWLAEQSKGSDSDVICITSSDDEAFNTDYEMESGLKKLRLSEGVSAAGGNKKTVRFNPQALVTDSEDDDEVDIPYGQTKVLNPEFRAFANNALYNWDGQPSVQVEAMQRSDDQDMPPFVYRWMARKMMKMQLKKAKQERKAMKQEMKAAMRRAKHTGYRY